MKKILFLLPLLLQACSPAVDSPVKNWEGKWTGPEGTFLEVMDNGEDGYHLGIQSLDGLATYPAQATADGLMFERNGKTETIRAGSGKETGMKWLLEKKDCLIITKGEGFCRD